MLHQDVWLHKGIQFEGLPTQIPDTVQELNDKCFAQFGISHHILSYFITYLEATIKMHINLTSLH